MKYRIVEISKDEHSKIENELLSNYATLQSIYLSELKYFGLFDKGNNLIATFCIYSFNKLWQKHVITPPFLTDIQLKMSSSASNISQINGFNRDVLSSISSFLKGYQHTYLELVFPKSIKDGLPFEWDNFDVGIRYTYYIDLNLNETSLLSNMSTQRRKNIRDAEKENYEVRTIRDPQIISEKAVETLSSKKAKFNPQIIESFSKLAQDDSLTAIGIYEDDKLIALSTCFNSEGESTYLFGWNSGKTGHAHVGTYALWNCIIEAKKHSRWFNFAGSQIPSVEKYFRGFGASITPLISIISDKRKLTKQFT